MDAKVHVVDMSGRAVGLMIFFALGMLLNIESTLRLADGKVVPADLVQVAYPVLFLVAIGPMLAASGRLRVGEGSVTVDRRPFGFSVGFSEITRLIHIGPAGLGGALSSMSIFRIPVSEGPEPIPRVGTFVIETRDGRSFELFVPKGKHAQSAELARALDEIAARTGLSWEEGPRGERDTGSFRSFLETASERRTPGELWTWVLGSMTRVRPEIAGLFGRAPRIALGFLGVGALATFGLFLLAMSLKPGDILTVHRTRRTVYSLAGGSVALFSLLTLVSVTCTSFGANLLLGLVRVQRRGRERLEAELSAAREVQRKLLPAAPPQLEGLDVAAVCTPAQDVGGDYFDFFPMGEGRLAVVVADVSGKGLGACLLMTMTKGTVGASLRLSPDLRRALETVDAEVSSSAARRAFVTMALAVVDPASGRVTLARAGHTAALVVRSKGGGAEWLSPKGLALGMTTSRRFGAELELAEEVLGPGDLLVLYSDGVSEAMNGAREEYGLDRLAALVARERHGSAEEIRRALVADVAAFRGGAAVSDDLTAVVVKSTRPA